jgi:hypothetical protein
MEEAGGESAIGDGARGGFGKGDNVTDKIPFLLVMMVF